ncbi:hypothetical protein PoB_006285500 [Plakobranchus ocellatus]|uniref:Uncharacterized protein n=1 Tax=Plakobranchus ocellatus TaxID=259542 RepID=A0AAV4CX40_9GAST|nr:hypothetical protein PoB_006285500 [Plakobranchus ocellatus]
MLVSHRGPRTQARRETRRVLVSVGRSLQSVNCICAACQTQWCAARCKYRATPPPQSLRVFSPCLAHAQGKRELGEKCLRERSDGCVRSTSRNQETVGSSGQMKVWTIGSDGLAF